MLGSQLYRKTKFFHAVFPMKNRFYLMGTKFFSSYNVGFFHVILCGFSTEPNIWRQAESIQDNCDVTMKSMQNQTFGYGPKFKFEKIMDRLAKQGLNMWTLNQRLAD